MMGNPLREFGRTVRENGSRGTDHGVGCAMLHLGGGVRGGKVHGHFKALRACRPGVDVAKVFPGFTPPAQMGLFSA